MIIDPNESVQEQSHREWRENAARVSANPEAASEKDLRRAIGYLDTVRRRIIRSAQEAGRLVSAEALASFDNEQSYYVLLINKAVR